MTCDIGKLRAYVDGALPSHEHEAVEHHLMGCTTCQETLADLQSLNARVVAHLDVLGPQRFETSDAGQAWARFHTWTQPAHISTWTTLKWRFDMLRKTALSSRWRPAIIGVVGLAFLVALFSFAPARHAAAQFLSTFRVRRFAAIPVDPARMAELERLGEQMDTTLFGEPMILREAGDPVHVGSIAEASDVAGFSVREPSELPEGTRQQEIVVETGPAIQFEVDRATAETLVQAAGLDDVTLPPFDTATMAVDFPTVVHLKYRVGGNDLEIVQMPSPTVDLPSGIDPAAMGEIFLRLLGMPADEARRMAQSIDWTSTLVIPMPTDTGRFREVEIGGDSIGMLFEPTADSPHYPGGLILWQRDDIVYGVSGEHIRASVLVSVANSL